MTVIDQKHMWNDAHAPSYRAVRSRRVGGFQLLVLFLDLALEVRRERQMLWSMDERALKDIGFNRGEAHVEAQRWFWDLPAGRLCG